MTGVIWGYPIWRSQAATQTGGVDPNPDPVTDSNFSQANAAQTLGGQRAVYESSAGYYYAGSDIPEGEVVQGITTAAYALGETATIRTAGPMEDLSWSWIPEKPIWLGINGLLTQTPPNTGILVLIAIALTSKRIHINIQRPVHLE